MPVAIITGSDSGIGKASAVALANAGFDLGVTWHEDREGAEETAREADEAGRRAAVEQLDLTHLPEAAEVVDQLADELGGLDVFVNNAGGAHAGPVLELSLDAWRRTLDLDLTGAFLCLQHAARRMVTQRRGGRLIAVTSIHEHLPLRDSAAYGAAKGGLGMLMKSLALELGPHGITANAVAPGEIATKMTGQEAQEPRSEERDLPVPRPGHAREIAGMIGFLASPEGAYTTGQSLIVDGGMFLMGPIANRG